jgi:hypothetical protein
MFDGLRIIPRGLGRDANEHTEAANAEAGCGDVTEVTGAGGG